MLRRWSTSKDVTKKSLNYVLKDKEIILFLIVSGMLSSLCIGIFGAPLVFFGVKTTTSEGALRIAYTLISILNVFIVYLIVAFVTTFFNVCTIYTVRRRFEGGEPTVKESVSFASTKLKRILSWSVLAATVGLILKLLSRGGKTGSAQFIFKIIGATATVSWGLATIFAVPSMIFFDLGPVDAIKKSCQILKRTWGEYILKNVTIMLPLIKRIIIGVLVGIALLIVVNVVPLIVMVVFNISPAAMFGAQAILSVTIMILMFLYILALTVVFTTAMTVYDTALFLYAHKHTDIGEFKASVLSNSFKQAK